MHSMWSTVELEILDFYMVFPKIRVTQRAPYGAIKSERGKKFLHQNFILKLIL